MEIPAQPATNGNRSGRTCTNGSVEASDLMRLLSVAIISRRFRELLLNDPATALDNGFYEQEFDLTPEERDFVLSMHATNLNEFAIEVTRYHASTEEVRTA